jgi:hypothetical protein
MDTLIEPEETVIFTVPYLTPPSVNHHVRPCKYIGRDGQLHTGKKLTKQTKAYYDAVAIFARGRTVDPQTPAARRKVIYSVEVDVYLGPGQRLDADNGGKCAVDALVRAGVIHSDAFVKPFTIRPQKDDRQNPRTEYCVRRTN